MEHEHALQNTPEEKKAEQMQENAENTTCREQDWWHSVKYSDESSCSER